MKKMKNLLTIVMLVALVALPTKAQTFGGNNSLYSTAPTASFQSTSTMPVSGSMYAAHPALNADGTALYGGKRPGGGPRKGHDLNGGGSGSGDSGGMIIDMPSESDKDQPIGDGTWILMFLAVGYAFFVAWKKRRVNSEE